MKTFLLLNLLLIFNLVQASQVTSERIIKAVEYDDYQEMRTLIQVAAGQSNELDGLTLILMAGLSADSEDVRSFGLYYYQSMIRVGVDVEVFPPKNEIGKDKVAAFLVFINKLNPYFKEHVFYNSEELKKLSELLPLWKPVCNELYSPGWIIKAKPEFIKCNNLIEEKISGITTFIKYRSTLLNHKEYLELLKKIEGQSINDLTNEEINDIKNRLYKIEKKLELKGAMTQEIEK